MPIPEWTIADFIHHGPWWRNKSILLLNLYLVLPLLSAATNGLDSSMLNGLQILPGWQDYFHTPTSKTLGLVNAANCIGALVGIPITPIFSDLVGRRMTLFMGGVIMLAGIIMQAMASTVYIFIGARIIGECGFGMAFTVNAAPLLISELAYPTQRGKLSSLFNTMWYFGSIVSAWICLGAYDRAGATVWSWRAPVLVQLVIPTLQISLIWLTPESPRYLVSKGLESQAARILAKYHSTSNDERDPLVVFEMAQIRHALKLEKEISSGTSYWTCFSTAGNRKRMTVIFAIALFSQWSGNGLVSYYINMVLNGVGITSTRTKAAINGGLQVFNLASAICGALLVDKLGRRKVFLVSNIGMLIAFSMWTLTTALFDVSQNAAAAKATVPLIFLYYFFYDFAYTPMLISYTLEILPYKIRARGFAIMNFTVYAAVAFNQFVNPWALEALGWRYYLVYCGWLVLELLFIMVYIIETRGRTLEETAALFDGEKGPQEIEEKGGEAATMTMNQLTSRTGKREKGLAEEEYFELQEGSGFHLPSTRPPSQMDSQSEESAIALSV
ncbi:general substrate transporter [Coniophora puteana RWD-64-598 SS2]|uniref:General substrate transporter n=1 Tax=Coniophora puteana (strain RWD-64-598) TaxID=741705 RepID=A0A5M3MYQ7_CONPW|nr:general substrate transporter [Coniophora puteana RWD-64-598 SS2]EIW84270.1 general substrate transporter [Coniophora puteana RWD-64-598 SS2]